MQNVIFLRFETENPLEKANERVFLSGTYAGCTNQQEKN